MTTKADTTVKWFHSQMVGAPTLRGQAGALIELFDACLVNGFDVKNINNLSVSNGIATAEISSGHGYLIHSVINIQGVTGSLSALNDEWRVSSATATSLTFACPGLQDGSATGTITAMLAPVGWEKKYSGTNIAVYKSTDFLSTGMFLRINDTDARYARVRGYEVMTDVDNGTNPFPTLAQRVETAFTWAKSDVSSAASRRWVIVADGRTIHFLPAWYAPNANSQGIHEYLRFGDFQSWIVNDPYSCEIAALPIATPSFTGGTGIGSAEGITTAGGCYLARNRGHTAGAVQHTHASIVSSAGQGPAVDSFPDLLAPIYILDGATGITTDPIRGVVRGVNLFCGKKSSDVGYLQDITSESSVLYVRAGRGDQTGNFQFLGFDIKGPWV